MKITINRAQILAQIRANIVAIMSMIVALTGMAYNTWRNEKTEINHSVRIAAVRDAQESGRSADRRGILALSEKPSARRSGAGMGADDLYSRSRAGPARPGPAEAERLWAAWRDNVEGLGTNDEAMVKITDELQLLRLTTLEILGGLH